jgi:hypothetical protein
MRCALIAVLVSIEVLAADLVRRNGVEEDLERAAFLGRDADGNLFLWEWQSRRFRTAVWSGAIPEGVFAVIHTHPVRLPRPSPQDVSEASRIGMPIYVATRVTLCVAQPSGEVRCESAKARAQKGSVATAGHDRRAAVLQVNPKR